MKKTPKKPPRNGSALAAHSRKGGAMKHRLEPKQGAKNDQPELLSESDVYCTNCQDIGYTFDKIQAYKLDCNCPAGKAYRQSLLDEVSDTKWDDAYIGVDMDDED